jgi:probable HAF family extracellular repeat protein
VVTGLAEVNNATHAIRWTSADGLTDLGASHVGRSAGLGVNDAGVVVGEVSRPPVGGFSTGDHAVLWSAAGVATDLGDLMGGAGQSHAHDINNSGVVTGWSSIAGGASAFIWTSATGMQSIGDLPGASHISYGQAINESSQVVGYGYGPSGYRAFLWSAADGMLDLGTPAGGSYQVLGNALNDAAEVVGNFADPAYDQSAFYWSSGTGMLDLNSVVDTAGWRLIDATGINNRGQIVGWMRQGQNDHAFVLTPVAGGVPEPGTWMLLIAGFGGAGAALRRRTARAGQA